MLTLTVITDEEERSFDFPSNVHWNYDVRYQDRMNPDDVVLWIHSRNQILLNYPEILNYQQKIRSYGKSAIKNIQLHKDNELIFDSSRLNLNFEHVSIQLNESAEIENDYNNHDYYNEFRFLVIFRIQPLTEEELNNIGYITNKETNSIFEEEENNNSEEEEGIE